MKKDFIVSKIDAPQDGSQYVLVTFTDRNEPRSAGKSGEAIPFTSPEDLMKNLPKAMSNITNMFGGGGAMSDSPTFKVTMKEYDEMKIKVGDKVTIDVQKFEHNDV